MLVIRCYVCVCAHGVWFVLYVCIGVHPGGTYNIILVDGMCKKRDCSDLARGAVVLRKMRLKYLALLLAWKTTLTSPPSDPPPPISAPSWFLTLPHALRVPAPRTVYCTRRPCSCCVSHGFCCTCVCLSPPLLWSWYVCCFLWV